MQRYKNLSGNSGVRAYALAADAIDIEFASGAVYRYDHESTGSHKVKTMQALAKAGEGLSTFIAQHVGDAYAAKIR